MNYKNKWIGLSLIALAVFSACTDEVENGGQRPGKGDHSLSFAVSTPGWQAFTKADGTHAASAPATQELEPVEMEGKVNGKTVYLTAEVAEGFPSDRQPMTRGTQVTDANKTNDGIMQTFAVSAYTDKTGKPDFMYSVPTTKGSPENGTTYWYPEEKFYWPGVKTLNFYAWYPHAANAEGLTVSGADQNGAPTLHYIVPDDVKKQMDVMTAVASDQSELEAIPLTFNHALAAVKFVAGNDLPNCVVKSIKLYGLQFEGTYDIGTSTWTDVKPAKKDFTVTWGDKAVEGTVGSPVTAEDETFFMMPQTLNGASVEVTFKDTDNSEFTVGATLTGTWEKGYTYTYKISFHNNIELDLSKDVFVASGDDAVIYVKSNLDWVCTLSDPNGIAGDAAPALCKPSLKGNNNGVKSDNFSNENAKLTIETISPTDTQTRKGKVKLTFTFPSKPGKTVEKEVTLTSSLMVEYPAGSDIWYKVTKGTITGEKLVTTDIPAIPDNADFATAIAKVVGADVTYSRELVATRVLNDDDATQCLTKFAIRRAKADGSTTTVTFSVITLERQDDSLTFDEKNFMTWGDIYYPIGSTWVVNKDNFNVTTDTEDLGKKSVWESIAAPSWSYNQANFSFMDQVYMMPGYRTMQNTNLTIYSIEKVSN